MTDVYSPADLQNIRELNDAFRRTFIGGTVVCTAGVLAMPPKQRARALSAVRLFEQFDEDNDPHREHDFGLIDCGGEAIMFKIDYYDRSVRIHSPDPADPAVTARVLTIMLASEY